MAKRISQNHRYINILIYGAALVSLVIAPDVTYDPINTPKFSVLLMLGGFALGLIQMKKDQLVNKKFRSCCLALTFFIGWLGISFFFVPGNKTSQFYGVFGRHTGLVTYVALTLIFLAIVLHANEKLLVDASKIFTMTGVLSLIYGYLQIYKLDPITWAKDSNRIVGTFANPNFFSSFIALTMIYQLSFLLSEGLKFVQRTLIICYILGGFFLLTKITSYQGFLVFLAGAAVISILYIQKNKKLKKFIFVFYAFFMALFISLVLDMLQKAPWSSYLYKPSVSVRGDYWRASIAIIADHPIFGIGMDNLRNWYPLFRDKASLTHGEPTIADAAHSYFLDMGLGGGVPGFLAYIFIVLLTIVSALRIINRKLEFDFRIFGIIGCWVGLQAQSVISISHLGLGIWGWVFSAIIVGTEIYTRPQELEIESKSDYRKTNSISRKSGTKKGLVISTFGTLFGFGLSLPLLMGGINYQNAMREGNAVKLSNAANQWPQDALLMSRTASFLITNGYSDIGISLAKNAAKLDPNFSVPWKILAFSGQVSEIEKDNIMKKIDKLDPLFRLSDEYKLMAN